MNEHEKMLLETVLKSLIERENYDATADSGIENTDTVSKSIDKDKKGANDKIILDVDAIARALIVGTESDQRDTTSVASAFESIRSSNKPALDALAQATGEAVPQACIDALKVYFMPPAEAIDSTCRDLSTMFTRHVVLSAYSLIFKEYSASPAGFVNESFLAGLLGGSSIPASGATTIADMQFQGGAVGISLKTVNSKSKLDGSFSNLMRTLGIKYRVGGEGKRYQSTADIPQHKSGLFYLLFNKISETSHRISCFRVDREEIIAAFEEYNERQQGQKMSKDPDGTYVFRAKKDYNDLVSRFAPLLGIKFDSIVDDSVIGISNYVPLEQNIDLQVDVVADAGETNIRKIIDTLNLLNKFYSVYYNSVISFASSPTGKNLEDIKKDLLNMATIDPKNLIKSDNCS